MLLLRLGTESADMPRPIKSFFRQQTLDTNTMLPHNSPGTLQAPHLPLHPWLEHNLWFHSYRLAFNPQHASEHVALRYRKSLSVVCIMPCRTQAVQHTAPHSGYPEFGSRLQAGSALQNMFPARITSPTSLRETRVIRRGDVVSQGS